MYLHKYQHPANFTSLSIRKQNEQNYQCGKQVSFKLREYRNDVYRLTFKGPLWKKNRCLSKLTPPQCGPQSKTTLALTQALDIILRDERGNTLLESAPGESFGQCGEAFLFQFRCEDTDAFYGMGEKHLGLELGGVRTKFWNTDEMADFHPARFMDGNPPADPAYLSIPYLIIKRRGYYLGLLLNNPHASFISTNAHTEVEGLMSVDGGGESRILIGSEGGVPDLFILHADSLHALTCKYQQLVGVTPRPPVWALGHHQCRWGYESAAHLNELDEQFRKHDVPCDGLWLDIGYMRGYRVFTLDDKLFPASEQALAKLAEKGRKIIPIIDPGVKQEEGYCVYDAGREKDAFCRNPQGQEYVGIVWPGKTVFPDFSMPEVRAWWAALVEAFAAQGFPGAWLDMNDPSTGPVDNLQMLFRKGKVEHAYYHNQYALGMAMATNEGFRQAQPNERPFLLSRSGFIGSQRYTAIWTGDNFSNTFHLKASIPTTLNLALSGIPFNGPDIGGFGGDTNAALLETWYQAGFLFPFCRNHSAINAIHQEPWAFGKHTLLRTGHFIRERYRFLPYLYQCFITHERDGSAIMRPLFYNFESTPSLPLEKVDDQYMLGDALMHAPLLTPEQHSRSLILPGNDDWYSFLEGQWISGGRKIELTSRPLQTPLFGRSGSIVPMAKEIRSGAEYKADNVAFHLFFKTGETQDARFLYTVDDGHTLDYQKGQHSELEIRVRVDGRSLKIETAWLQDACGVFAPDFLLYDRFDKVTLNDTPLKPVSIKQEMLGTRQKLWQATSSK